MGAEQVGVEQASHDLDAIHHARTGARGHALATMAESRSPRVTSASRACEQFGLDDGVESNSHGDQESIGAAAANSSTLRARECSPGAPSTSIPPARRTMSGTQWPAA